MLFISKYKRKEINLPSEKNERKKYDKNNVTIALNVPCKERKNISYLCFKI